MPALRAGIKVQNWRIQWSRLSWHSYLVVAEPAAWQPSAACPRDLIRRAGPYSLFSGHDTGRPDLLGKHIHTKLAARRREGD